jgi:hypothetical protein
MSSDRKVGRKPSITDEEALEFHSMGKPGKIEINPTKPMATQVDWSILVAEIEQTGELSAALLQRMAALASRAERIAVDAEREGHPETIVTDSLLVAAQCRLELREWRAADALFDRAANYEVPEPLAIYAGHVARLCVIELLGVRAAPVAADVLDDLSTSARLGVERARRVLAIARRSERVHPDDVATARGAVLACSAYVGDAATALPAALAWCPSGGPLDDALAELARRTVAAGGVLLDPLPGHAVDADEALARLRAGLAAVEQAWRSGAMAPPQVATALHAFREPPGGERLTALRAWPSFRADVDDLAARVR